MRPDSNPSAVTGGRDTATECRNTHAFVGRFLAEKPVSCRRIERWRQWATNRILAGWTSEQCAEHLSESWRVHVLLHPLPPKIGTALAAALFDCLAFVRDGASPAHAAVVYRSLAAEYPEQDFLAEGARVFQGMGDRWQDAYAHERQW